MALVAGVAAGHAVAASGGVADAPQRLDLGDREPGLQAYNFQEVAGWRTWALSARGFAGSRVMLQRLEADGRWGPAVPAPFTDARWRDSDPHLSPDGRVLTFASDRPASGDAPTGQLDLYESRREDDGRWSVPRRLPDAVQSGRYELGPERIGSTLYFGSARPGGAGPLSVWRSEAGGPPELLPAPVNDASQNSDFTVSPDGRWALWWSLRSGGGDLYVAERRGTGFGPAMRLPEPVNGPAFEFTPAISPDGQWLTFASTRGADGAPAADGLAHVWRVRWPEVLAGLRAADAAPASTAPAPGAADPALEAVQSPSRTTTRPRS